jgi:hypothetical protein
MSVNSCKIPFASGCAPRPSVLSEELMDGGRA